MMVNTRCLFTVAGVIASVSSISAAVPVEGDVQLLNVFLDAQRTNLTKFERGSLHAKARRETWPPIANSEMQWETAEATVIWDGPNTYWNYVVSRPEIRDARILRKDGEPVLATSSAELIETPGELILYVSSSPAHIYHHHLGHASTYENILRLRPDQVWFTYRQLDQAPWHSFFNPQSAPGKLNKIQVSKDGDQLVVQRHSKSGAVFTAVASLAHGGNVISYEATPGPTDDRYQRQRASYEWERHTSGEWWLKRLEAEMASAAAPKKIESRYVLEVVEFDPAPTIASDRFKMASFHAPKGTYVTETRERRPVREYRIGGSVVVGDQLDRLADEARQNGFAQPDR